MAPAHLACMNQHRQPRGIPVGGQFASTLRDESAVTLVDVDTSADSAGVAADSDLTPAEVVYEFPAWKLDRAIASIDKANRRAERAGIDGRFTYTVEKFEVRRRDPDTGFDVVESRARLTLDRPKVSHDGWEFAATLTWDDEAGMISRAAPGARLLERPTDRLCDVCGKQRDRKDTYVVQRDGVQMQVGSDCLQRFMGIRPAGLWMLDFDVEQSGDSDEPPASARVEERHDTVQIIGLGLAVTERYGWVSRAAANEGTRAATADRVAAALANRPQDDATRREFAELWARAAELEDEAREVREFARTIDGNSDYAQNLRQIASADSVSPRNAAMLLSAIGSSRRAKEQAAERAAQASRREQAAQVSQWVGKPKDKVTGVEVTVDSVRVVTGDYGNQTIVTMTDTSGNRWKWWASGDQSHACTPGTQMLMKGTIKDHGAYDGVKETTVTRAKLEPPGGTPGPAPVPAANPANPYADIHTTDDLDRKLNRQYAAWRRSGKVDDADAMAEVERHFKERWDELSAARRAAARTEHASAPGR